MPYCPVVGSNCTSPTPCEGIGLAGGVEPLGAGGGGVLLGSIALVLPDIVREPPEPELGGFSNSIGGGAVLTVVSMSV